MNKWMHALRSAKSRIIGLLATLFVVGVAIIAYGGWQYDMSIVRYGVLLLLASFLTVAFVADIYNYDAANKAPQPNHQEP